MWVVTLVAGVFGFFTSFYVVGCDSTAGSGKNIPTGSSTIITTNEDGETVTLFVLGEDSILDDAGYTVTHSDGRVGSGGLTGKGVDTWGDTAEQDVLTFTVAETHGGPDAPP